MNIKSKFDNNLLYLDLLERIEVFGFCNRYSYMTIRFLNYNTKDKIKV